MNYEVESLTKSQILGWILLALVAVPMFLSIKSIFEEGSEENKLKNYNIGEILQLGNFNYKVNNFEIRNSNDMQDRNDLILSVDVTSESEKSESVSFE